MGNIGVILMVLAVVASVLAVYSLDLLNKDDQTPTKRMRVVDLAVKESERARSIGSSFSGSSSGWPPR
jgi:hypothetical protein